MTDNTTLNPTAGGDTIRDIARSGVKTQVVQLDAGGQSAESLVSQATPLPVLVSDGTNAVDLGGMARQQLALQAMCLASTKAQNDMGNGFVPLEFPSFLGIGA